MFGHLPNALNQILPPKILFLSAIPTPLKTSLSITITRQTKRFQLTISTLFYFIIIPPISSFSFICSFLFFSNFQEQGIVSSEEWDAFVQVLRTPLPAAFRINSTYFFIYFYFNCFSILTLCESSAQLSTTNELQYETN